MLGDPPVPAKRLRADHQLTWALLGSSHPRRIAANPHTPEGWLAPFVRMTCERNLNPALDHPRKREG